MIDKIAHQKNKNIPINVISGIIHSESLLWLADEPYFTCFSAYRACGLRFLSVIRKLWLYLNLPGQSIWYNREVLLLTGVTVVMDSEITPAYLKWLSSQNPNIVCKLFYWNTIENHRLDYQIARDLGYDIYSFDPDDCEKYGLKLNREFYCDSWYNDIRNETIKYDAVFVGRDKNNRMNEVLSFVEKCDDDINWKLVFTPNKWWQRFSRIGYSSMVGFTKMLRIEMQGKAVLDYSQNIQSTITCRTYDALVNGRKVITNNPMIMDYPYYNSNDIFVIGVDDPADLKSFLDSPYKEIDMEILEEQSAKRWCRVFIED